MKSKISNSKAQCAPVIRLDQWQAALRAYDQTAHCRPGPEWRTQSELRQHLGCGRDKAFCFLRGLRAAGRLEERLGAEIVAGVARRRTWYRIRPAPR